MTLITRRSALRGMAAIPAISAPGLAFACGGSEVPADACIAPAATPALPDGDPRELLEYWADGYRRVAMLIDPTATEWWQGQALCDHTVQRFTLIGSRKAVRS